MEKSGLLQVEAIDEFDLELDLEEEVEAQQQRTRSRSWKRALAAVVILGLVGSVLLVDPVQDGLIQANVMNKESKFGGFGNMWDTMKSVSNTVKASASGLAQSVGTPKFLRDAICKHIKEELPAIEKRLLDKMTADLMDATSECGKNFQSEECTELLTDNACSGAGSGLRETFCKTVFGSAIEKMQNEIPTGIMKTQQNLNESPLVKFSLSLPMRELDAKIDKECKD